MGYLTTGLKNECYACSACCQSCPKKAISMQEDNEGFIYPVVEKSLCINCDLCKRVCPAEKDVEKTLPLKAVSVINNREDILIKSSSGGAFKSLLDICDDKTAVYGVLWKTRSKAVFERCSKNDAFERFRKSKYVQAELNETFNLIKNDLSSSERVLFVGTPCQVSGLKEFLQKPYDNLLTVDLICHGVPSSKILEKQFEGWDKKGDRAASVQFRHKEVKNGIWNSKYAIVNYESGKSKVFEYDTSAFLRGYDNGLFFRPSCSTCQYATKERVADITIGDYWGCKEFDVHKGVSLVFANTEKGLSFISELEAVSIVDEVDFDWAVSNNARLKSPDKGHKNRKEFFERIDKEDFEKLVQRYVPRVPEWKKIAHKILKG